MSTNNAHVSSPQSFMKEASDLHERALFNPFAEQREQALAAARKQSSYTPAEWAQFDVAAGIRTKEQVEEQFELTADSTMPVNSWIEYSDDVLEDHEQAPSTLNRLIGAGFSTGSTLARYAHVRPISSDGEMEADVDMNTRARARQDLPAYGLDGVALPVVHADWELDSREYQQSQAFGEDIDARVAGNAREAIERTEDDMLFEGWGGTIDTRDGPFGVPGFATGNPQVLSGTAAGSFDTAQNVLDTLDSIQQTIEGQADDGSAPSPRQSGAIALVPTQQMTEIQLGQYTSSATDEPLMDRIERKYPYLSLWEAPQLQSGHLTYLINDTRYFEVVVAQGVTSTSWDVDGGFGRRSKMLSSRIPWIKKQPDGINGIMRVTGA